MKNSHTCPKCQSQDIVRVPGWSGAYGAGNNIPTARALSFSRSSVIPVARYVCGCCGFSEEWIDTAEDVAKLRKAFPAD